MNDFNKLLECMKVGKRSITESRLSQKAIDRYLPMIPDSYEGDKLAAASEVAYRAVNGVYLPQPHFNNYKKSDSTTPSYNIFGDLTDEEKLDILSRFKPSTLSKWKQ